MIHPVQVLQTHLQQTRHMEAKDCLHLGALYNIAWLYYNVEIANVIFT